MKLIYEYLKPRTIFALLIYGPVAYLCVTGQEIPDLLGNALMALMGFYFGQKFPEQPKKEG